MNLLPDLNLLRKVLLTLIFFSIGLFGYTQTALSPSSLDPEILNQFILTEVNKLRKKAKVEPVQYENALSFAADDHAGYMLRKRKLTHNQRLKIKKTPKNRVDFYGAQFDRVGENVQLNNLNLEFTPEDKHHPLIGTYEKLAEELVLSWKNSPPHYANMINPDFKTSYTSVAVGEKGEIYACQLFGGAKYKDIYSQHRDTSFQFKPDRPGRCWRCKVRPVRGFIEITEDSTIIYTYYPPRIRGIVVPSIFNSRMRFFNPWRDGLAADIIVKSQYSCDSSSYHNGLSNFRGIPLAPVYKKDFMGIPIGKTQVVLGKVPDFIDEEFEVNLVVIQNKRPCSNTMFHLIPTEFNLEIPVKYDFEPSETVLKNYKTDTISKRIFFDKAMISPRDSVLTEISEWVKINKSNIQEIQISGYASIEGTTENNSVLYQNRTRFLFTELIALGVDSSSIKVESSENFKDFRKDIIGTEYEYLNKLSDPELKEKLLSKDLSVALEFILNKHRYVDLKAITRLQFEFEYNAQSVNEELQGTIKKENVKKSAELQAVQYGLLLSGKMSMEEIQAVEIPMDEKFVGVLHNKAVMKFLSDTLNLDSLKAFRAELWQIRSLKPKDKQLNTSIAIIDYHLYTMGQYRNKKITFYDSIRKLKNVDEVQRARILLNVAYRHDWGVWITTGSHKDKDYLYGKVKPYIRKSRLEVDKTFEVASYYSFFYEHDYAYYLTKGKIDETENPYDLIFFLKLIHFTDLELPEKTYLRYFKKVQQFAGDDFCSFFNSPALNFQIFDNPEIKEIYCKACREVKSGVTE